MRQNNCPPGPPGPKGPPGERGSDGADGIDGLIGKDADNFAFQVRFLSPLAIIYSTSGYKWKGVRNDATVRQKFETKTDIQKVEIEFFFIFHNQLFHHNPLKKRFLIK